MIHTTSGDSGKLIDCLKRIVILDSPEVDSLVSNWVCEPCYLVIRSLGTAEKRVDDSKKHLEVLKHLMLVPNVQDL